MRATAFGALYIILGKRVWFFPNILAEEATLRELFRFWPQKDEEERPKWTTRLFYAMVAVLVILVLRHHAPDEAARARLVLNINNLISVEGKILLCLLLCMCLKYQSNQSFRYQKRVSNIIDDVLEWSPRLALSGMMDKQQTVDNETEANNSFTDASKAPSDNVGEETVSEQYAEEQVENLEGADQHKHDDHI